MRRIRGLVYRLGFRPKPGSIFYSPSRDWILACRNFGRDFERALNEAQWAVNYPSEFDRPSHDGLAKRWLEDYNR